MSQKLLIMFSGGLLEVSSGKAEIGYQVLDRGMSARFSHGDYTLWLFCDLHACIKGKNIKFSESFADKEAVRFWREKLQELERQLGGCIQKLHSLQRSTWPQPRGMHFTLINFLLVTVKNESVMYLFRGVPRPQLGKFKFLRVFFSGFLTPLWCHDCYTSIGSCQLM